jgi:sugar phosphate permease
MRSAAAALIAFSGTVGNVGHVLAHPGHGAAEGHFHWLGVEHVILFAVVFLLLAFAIRK